MINNLSVDCIIFGFDGENLEVLLWKVKKEIKQKLLQESEHYEENKVLFEKHPMFSTDLWGLIGDHVPQDIDIDDFAKQITSSITGLKNVYLKQIRTFGRPKRVPYYRVVTIGYYALINSNYHHLKQSELAKELKWFKISELPELIFDHKEIILKALNKLRDEVRFHPVGFHLLPDFFTLTQLQALYEAILGYSLDTRNFRKKLSNMKLLVDTNEKQQNVAHRAAKLYKFDKKIYDELVLDGLNFKI